MGILVLLAWLLIVARVVVSWVDPGGRHPASRSVILWTEPFLAPIRRFLPPLGGLDFAPLLLLLVLGAVLRVVGV